MLQGKGMLALARPWLRWNAAMVSMRPSNRLMEAVMAS
jgi:hypothetical protein